MGNRPVYHVHCAMCMMGESACISSALCNVHDGVIGLNIMCIVQCAWCDSKQWLYYFKVKVDTQKCLLFLDAKFSVPVFHLKPVLPLLSKVFIATTARHRRIRRFLVYKFVKYTVQYNCIIIYILLLCSN